MKFGSYRFQLKKLSAYLFRLRRSLIFSIILSLTTGIFGSQALEQNETLAGKLLVATSEMGDPRFGETVIYMVKDDDSGAMGLVINRPMAKGPIGDLLKSFGIESDASDREIILHYGGPVGQNQGFLLHSDDVLLDDSTKVKDGVVMTADTRILQAIARGKGPRQYLFMVGYAGWAPGQLEAEIKENAWYVVSADKTFIFGTDAEKKWRQALDKRQIPL